MTIADGDASFKVFLMPVGFGVGVSVDASQVRLGFRLAVLVTSPMPGGGGVWKTLCNSPTAPLHKGWRPSEATTWIQGAFCS